MRRPNGNVSHQNSGDLFGTNPQPASSPPIPAVEQARKQKIRDRQEAIGIDDSFLINLTDQVFYEKYPHLNQKTLTNRPEDAPMRLRWDGIAADLLDSLETHLSSEAIRRLGSYGVSDREQWRVPG